MYTRLLAALLLSFVAPCMASESADPYSGSGGLFLGTPSQEDIASGRAVYSAEAFSKFTIGTTTKTDIVAALGVPAGWDTNDDGTTVLEYDFVAPNSMMGMRRVYHIFLNFDKKRVLIKMDLPGSGG